jgi:MFS family permease
MADGHFAVIDEQKFRAFHIRTMLTTGLGVFCDGYDISCIGLVLPAVLQSYGIGAMSTAHGAAMAGLVTASALVGSMLGALVFGVLGQYGRKKFYGYDVMILGVAAAAQAFMPSFGWLVACRFLLGVGVGADYVLSPMIMAEHANRADRGKAMGLGFGTMWPMGALTAAVFKLLLDSFHVPADLSWKLVLAGGAVPALAILYFRRTMPESARFLARLADDRAGASEVMAEIGGAQVTAPPADRRPFGEVFAKHARHIFAGALLWLVYDLVVYAAILFGPNLIAQNLGIPASIYQILNELIFVLPASFILSLFVIDKMGRKPLQVWGFLTSAVVLLVFAWLRATPGTSVLLAFMVYGLFNITQTGPGLVSGAGVYGVELAPTRVRSVAQSATVIGGRIGASVSGYLFPVLVARAGLVHTLWILAGISLLGGVLSQLLVPETSSRSLEDINQEHAEAAAAPEAA